MKPWAWIAIIAVILIGVWAWYGTTHWVPDNQQAGTQTTTGTPVSGATSTGVTGPQTGTVSQNNQNGNDYSPGNLLLGMNSNAALGSYLVASNAMTLYTYSGDTNGTSNCTGTCAKNWPPYTVKDASVLANLEAGINGKSGTIMRSDGTMQVTYNGKPLYFYYRDQSPNDANGATVSGWAVAKP